MIKRVEFFDNRIGSEVYKLDSVISLLHYQTVDF